MTSAHKQHTIELLRAALRESLGDPELDAMSQRTILHGIVGKDPDLRNVWFQEAGPSQVEVDLHLEGEGVQGHSTNAHHFAVFISRIADAVKETAKDISGKQQYSSKLLIDALRPGSVAVTLRAPETKPVGDAASKALPSAAAGTESSSIDSQALRRIAQVMTLASDEDTLENEALLAAVEQLPIKAKRSLKIAVNEARKASWEIDGTIAERRRGIDDVHLSPRGAAKLADALALADVEQRPEQSFGSIDGLKYSLGVMWFQPDAGSGKSFAAAVREDRLLSHVAELAAEHGRVLATFDTFRSYASGSESLVKISRVLRSVEPAPLPQAIQTTMDYDSGPHPLSS